MRLFGSKARGEDTPESDIDVMIEIDEFDPEIESQIDNIIFEINLKNDTFISAVIFLKAKSKNDEIEREGFKIYGTEMD